MKWRLVVILCCYSMVLARKRKKKNRKADFCYCSKGTEDFDFGTSEISSVFETVDYNIYNNTNTKLDDGLRKGILHSCAKMVMGTILF